MAYTSLAHFYDEFTLDIDYVAMADRIEKIFKAKKISPKIVLDLACGTGSLTIELHKRGYEMIGVDLSEDMLNMAKDKANSEGIKDILFLNQDMTKLDLYGTVDAVICSLDGINHLLKPAQVIKCFQRVSLFLNKGGLFIFDINTPHKFKTQYANNAYVFETDKIFCSWQNSYNEKAKQNSFYFTFFYEENGVYKREDDFCLEKSYEMDEIKQFLEDTGLKTENIYGGEKGLKELKEDDFRAVFVTRKE